MRLGITLFRRQWGAIEGFRASWWPESFFSTCCIEPRNDPCGLSLIIGGPGLPLPPVAGEGGMGVVGPSVWGYCQTRLNSMVIPFFLLVFSAQDSVLAEEKITKEHQKEDTERFDSLSSAGSQVSQCFFWLGSPIRGSYHPDCWTSLSKPHPRYL